MFPAVARVSKRRRSIQNNNLRFTYLLQDSDLASALLYNEFDNDDYTAECFSAPKACSTGSEAKESPGLDHDHDGDNNSNGSAIATGLAPKGMGASVSSKA
jgi:hypothetical protein